MSRAKKKAEQAVTAPRAIPVGTLPRSPKKGGQGLDRQVQAVLQGG